MSKVVIEHRHIYKRPETTGFGIGFILAALLSWVVNHSIIWAVIHGILNWWYVIYWVFTKPW
jgi:hypothetical protein